MVVRTSWAERAETLRRANAALNLAADKRRRGKDGQWDRSDPSFADWKRCVEDFWQAMRAAYPPDFLDAHERLKTGDQGSVDVAVEFLEADPVCFRSGYLKEDFLRFLGRMDLDEHHRRRLREVILNVTASRDCREFRRYRRLAVKLDEPGFRRRLEQMAASIDPDVRRRARWILEAMSP